MLSGWRKEKILVLVKAYPQPSQKYGEAVCVAGLTEAGQWIRLYPIEFRQLPSELQFGKWTWIEGRIKKSASDFRLESYNLDHDSIKIIEKVSTSNFWHERRRILSEHTDVSLESLEELHKTEKRTLGYIKPLKILDFVIEPSSREWEAEKLEALKSATQPRLFEKNTRKSKVLEKIPFSFFYRFVCNDPSCQGHKLQILDWEVSESFRKWRKSYKSEDAALRKMRQRYFEEFTHTKDLGLILGTIFSRDRFGAFSIIGLVYPPKLQFEQLSLF